MTNKEALEITKQARTQSPLASGNSRRCYRVGNYAVLIEKGSLSELERTQELKKQVDIMIKNGINTPEIFSVLQENDEIVMIQQFVEGQPLYHRGEKSYCLGKNLPLPKNSAIIYKELRDEFNKKYGYTISQIMSFSREEKLKYNKDLEDYKAKCLDSDEKWKKEYGYFLEIERQVKDYNLKNAYKISQVSQKFYDKFLQDMLSCFKIGIRGIDCHSDNYMLNDEKGFVFVDVAKLDSQPTEKIDHEDMLTAFSFVCDILTRGAIAEEGDENKEKADKALKEILTKCFKSGKSIGLSEEECIRKLTWNVRKRFEEISFDDIERELE